MRLKLSFRTFLRNTLELNLHRLMIAFIVMRPLKCSIINKMDLKIDFDKNKCVECVDKKGKSF